MNDTQLIELRQAIDAIAEAADTVRSRILVGDLPRACDALDGRIQEAFDIMES